MTTHYEYQRKGQTMCNLDILQVCVHQRQTQEEDHQASEESASGPQNGY